MRSATLSPSVSHAPSSSVTIYVRGRHVPKHCGRRWCDRANTDILPHLVGVGRRAAGWCAEHRRVTGPRGFDAMLLFADGHGRTFSAFSKAYNRAPDGFVRARRNCCNQRGRFDSLGGSRLRLVFRDGLEFDPQDVVEREGRRPRHPGNSTDREPQETIRVTSRRLLPLVRCSGWTDTKCHPSPSSALRSPPLSMAA